MPDSFNGLPTHPLVVHATLAFVALAAVLGVVVAVRPRWRARLLPWTALVAVVAAATTIVASETGESLEHRVGEGALIQEHAELGEQTRLLALAFAALLVVWWLVDTAARRRATTTADRREDALVDGPGAQVVAARPRAGLGIFSSALAVLTVLLALTSAVWLYRTGDEGARAVWQNVPQQVDRGPGPGDAGKG